MGEAFLFRSGGEDTYAAIACVYPAGAVCTCSKGTKTLTAAGTGGHYTFYVPESGTWTVTATDGTRTKSQSVVISRKYQAEFIELAFLLTLFENGVLNPAYSLSGGFYINSNMLTLVEYADYQSDVGAITPAIDLSLYSTLHITGYRSGYYGPYCGLSTTTTGYNQNYIAIVSLDASSSTKTVDISSLTASAYIKAGVANAEVHLSKIWLE